MTKVFFRRGGGVRGGGGGATRRFTFVCGVSLAREKENAAKNF